MTDRPSFALVAVCFIQALAITGALFWAVWVTRSVIQGDPPKIVTVRLAETIGQFIDEAARADADPAAVQAASLAYLQAAELAVADMGKDGRVVLVAEAVLAGAAEDATRELETRIALRLQAEAQP